MKDNTCMYTGIFGTVVILCVTIVYAVVWNTLTVSEILFGIMTAALLDLACYLEHKTVNQKGENSMKNNTFKLIGIFCRCYDSVRGIIVRNHTENADSIRDSGRHNSNYSD